MNREVGSAVLRHIEIKRTARYAMLGEPSERVTEVWIACHGYAQLAERFIQRFKGIASPQRLIVAPEGLSRFYAERAGGFHGASSQVGASWMTAEDREAEIADYIGFLDAVRREVFAAPTSSNAVLRVLGFSQGATTAARWVAAGNSKADQLILWAGSLPTELDQRGAASLNASGRPVLLVAGERDEFITSKILDAQTRTLEGLGVATVVRRFPGGHEVDATTLLAVAEAWPHREK